MELVSIVVPIYNMQKYLHRCLESLLKIDYPNVEIILVDDGSTDDSGMICDEYVKQYPTKMQVVHKENGGLSSARNAGIQIATGKYIIFPDPDDWVEVGYISCALELQEKYPFDLVCMGYYVDSDDSSTPINVGETFKRMTKEEAQKALFVYPSIGGFAWNKLYFLDIINNNGLQFENNVGIAEDIEFAFRYLEYCDNVIFIPDKRVYHYYQRSDAATHGYFSRKKVESFNAYENMLIKVLYNNELKKIIEEELCNSAINFCWMYKRDNYDDKQSWDLIRKYLKRTIYQYIKSDRFSFGRKLQAVMALVMPGVYARIKSFIQYK